MYGVKTRYNLPQNVEFTSRIWQEDNYFVDI